MRRACAIALGVAASLAAQQIPTGTASALPSSAYLANPLPPKVVALLSGYGDRLQTPGNERVTFSGTYSDGKSSGPSTITAQIPGSVRVQVAGSNPRTLVYDGVNATSNGAQASGADLDLLESLQADTIENFFYSYGKSAAIRFLGGHFRTDNGKTAGYTGPYYDIYELVQPVAVKGGGPAQQKHFYFDSTTGQFVQSRYKISRDGQDVTVQTVYSNWTKSNGQSAPGKIERFENGSSVFSLTLGPAQYSAGAADGVFSKP